MSVKLFLLKSGEQIISEGKELFSGENPCGYLLEDPYKIVVNAPIFVENEENPEVSVSITPWMILSKDRNFPIPTDWVVTIAEPIESIEKMYEEQVNGSDN